MAIFKKSKLDQIQANMAADPTRPIVLLVDDEEANLRVMRSILDSSFRVICCSSGQQALDTLHQQETLESVACIISDQRMPGMTGVEMLQKSLAIAPDCNRIIVTGFSDITAIIDSINKAEIYRYVIKPFDTNDFVLTVQRAVETYQMKLQLRSFHRELEQKVLQRTQQLAEKNLQLERANLALQEASLTDPLTGLRNRRFLMQQLDADVAILMRRHEERLKAGQAISMCDLDLVFFMLDLDHFKAVNDEYGHAAGDLVLIQIRERLHEVFRESDYLTRWGGEEFLVVARASCRENASVLAERMRQVVANKAFQLEDGILIHKTCSIGYASFPFLLSQPHLFSWTHVVEMADHALYLAKSDGRNAWVGLECPETDQTDDLFLRINSNFSAALESGLLRKTCAESSFKIQS